MSTSTPSTAWSELLDSATSSSSLDASLLVLGNVGAGKTSLVRCLSAVRQRCPPSDVSSPLSGSAAATGVAVGELAPQAAHGEPKAGHSPIDSSTAWNTWVVDDRASPAQLRSATQSAMARPTVALVCIDMNDPWTCVEQGSQWLTALQRAAADSQHSSVDTETHWRVCRALVNGAASAEAGAEGGEEAAESLSQPHSIVAALASVQEVDPPLPPGVLTSSTGLPVVLVLTRMDALGSLSPDADHAPLQGTPVGDPPLSTRQGGVVVAALRSLALQWGAGLVGTSASTPAGVAPLLQLAGRLAAVSKHCAGAASPNPLMTLPLPLPAAAIAPWLLPQGADSPALVQDSLLLHSTEEGTAPTLDTVMPGHGGERLAAFKAALAPEGGGVSGRWRVFAPRAPPALSGVKAGSTHAKGGDESAWLGGLVQDFPALVPGEGSEAASTAALGTLTKAAASSRATLDAIGTEEEAPPKGKESSRGSKRATRKGADGEEEADKPKAGRRRAGRPAKAAKAKTEAAPAEAPNATDFFASLLAGDGGAAAGGKAKKSSKASKASARSSGRTTRSRAKKATEEEE